MKVVAALDSFKGSISSMEAGEAVKRGILRVFPEAQVKVCPLADGGEGTVEALTAGMGGRLQSIPVCGPLGEQVLCSYGIVETDVPGGNKTAVIEMAGAAGLTLVPVERRDPCITTTFGVGEVIRDAVMRGCRRFIVGIGGSATNDGGAGMLQALGYAFVDEKGDPVPAGAAGLKDLAGIRSDQVLPQLSECSFRIACDVTNPLCGSQGCSAVFGPQKGAKPEQIGLMDEWLGHYAALVQKLRLHADPKKPGAGAAGGLGFAFQAFTNSTLESGIKIVLEETGLEQAIRDADLVITGEGCLDAQTVMGKAPSGVAKLAKKYGKPVLAFSGCVTEDARSCNENGIDAYFPILRSIVTSEEAMEPERAGRNLTDTAEQVMRLLRNVVRNAPEQ